MKIFYLGIGLIFTLVTSVTSASGDKAGFGIDDFGIGRGVDPCTLTTHNSSILKNTILVPGYANSEGIDIYIEKSVKLSLPGTAPVVMIINGNGYTKERYEDMAEFLARNGFVVAVAERESTFGTDPLFPLNALYSVFPFHDLDDNSPVALIGHSKGGFVVNEAAIQSHEMGLEFKIKSLINVSPNILNVSPPPETFSGRITGYHTPSYLSLWGSRDRDMQGLDGATREGIAAYDRVGDEGTTTCGNPPCISWFPKIDKTSVYVNGADHAEIMGTHTTGVTIPRSSYLSSDDQFCVGKAYINAFLRKNLTGTKVFNGFLRNKALPLSLRTMETNDSDDLGEPAGSALRVYHQFSPKQKRTIENFEDNHYSLQGKSSQVVDFLIPENTNTGTPTFIRHKTDALFVAWEEKNTSQYIGFKIPAHYDDASSFTHLSIRVGLINGITFPMYANDNEDMSIRLGLRDQNYVTRTYPVNLPRPDEHTTMQTITIPIEDFAGLNLSRLQMVYLVFDWGTQGTILVDNIEFIRDTD